jgi:predicted metal-dependent peptidase
VAPGRSGHGAGTIVLGLDTSGSIFGDPTLINRWMAELTGILQDVRPREIHVVECDAAVQRATVMTDESDIMELKVMKGGGGTDFNPVFNYVEEEGLTPDCLLYLTDGYGGFPSEAPRYAVIWGNISGKDASYPFGDVVDVPTE